MANLADYFRLVKTGFVLAREGVFQSITLPADAPLIVKVGQKCTGLIARINTKTEDDGAQLNLALHRLGPSFVKIGQLMASRPDIVGPQMAQNLGSLRDNVPEFSQEKAVDQIEASLGKSTTEIFSRFNGAIAAASIAQVHKAEVTAPDGEKSEVAVKVLRPNIRQKFTRDIRASRAGASLFERFSKSGSRLRPVAVMDSLARDAAREMDLRLEAAALSEMASFPHEGLNFGVPTIDWQRTSKDVLTTEWVDGLKLSDLEGIQAAGHDMPKLAKDLLNIFLTHALEHGLFHADMHQGNLFVTAEGKIIAVDFGIMGRIGPKEQKFLAEILYGFVTRDYRRIADVHFDAEYVPPHHSVDDFAQALRAIGEPIHGQSANEISMANLLGLLFEITELFDMSTRTELLLLQKTMVVVEGVARTLDPEFNMWTAAEPLLRDWLTKQVGPAAKLNEAKEGFEAAGRLIKELPKLADRAIQMSKLMDEATTGGIQLHEKTVASLVEHQERSGRATKVSMMVIAASLATIAFAYLIQIS